SRGAVKSLVKLNVKRASDGNRDPDKHVSMVRRQRQHPDCPVTGVCIDPEGYIITSAFNIDGDINSIDAVLSDGTTLPATLLGRHMGLDVAVLKITHPKSEMLPHLPLTPEPDLKIGRFISILGAS